MRTPFGGGLVRDRTPRPASVPGRGTTIYSSPIIDTHCHLTFPEFESRVDEVVARAGDRGVGGVITISTTMPDAVRALAIARRHPRVWCSAGVHPLYSDRGPHDWRVLRTVGSDPRCVAWGELGLDNHYDRPALALQHDVLAMQLDAIAALGAEGIRKPVVLHCREAFDDLIPVLRASPLDPSRMVFHCFTGDKRNVRQALDLGAWVSFTGVVTYRNAPDVQGAARLVPDDRIMVETDAPFLPPEPHRRERPCEPWMSSVTAKFLADLRATPWGDFEATIRDNVRRFYGIDEPPPGAPA